MSKGFRVLASITAMSAYLQIALGGVVRNTGSGLGCQNQWPLCNGAAYPGWNVHAIVEYSHRTFGVLTSVLMLLTFFAALALYARRRPILAWTSGARSQLYRLRSRSVLWSCSETCPACWSWRTWRWP